MGGIGYVVFDHGDRVCAQKKKCVKQSSNHFCVPIIWSIILENIVSKICFFYLIY